MLADENSASRQVQVKLKLDALEIQSFMVEKNCTSEQDALTELVKMIDNLVPHDFLHFDQTIKRLDSP